MTTGAPLALYNSLTRRTEPFMPIDPALVRIYTCGPTVYNYQHIGNMRAFLFADTLGRVLRWKGWPTKHVINITDVGHLTSDADAGDDKMERAAAAQAKSIWEIAAHYTAAFKEDVARLNIVPPAEWTVATDHIPQMIAFAQVIEKDCYQIDSGLYFDVSKVPDYGALAGHVTDVKTQQFETAFYLLVSGDDFDTASEGASDAKDKAMSASRVGEVIGKRHPQDFAIWRRSPPGEQRQMEWDSPWGKGAPGWHLECSVMSLQHLGHPFDIHTGGIDHREIHHPNEIAQNQAHCGCADTGARFWMHNNFLVDRGSKMSKSAGDFLRLQTLIDAGFHPLAYRLMCLQAHYRSELEFSWDNLLAALTRLRRIVLAIDGLRAKTDGATTGDPAPYLAQIDAAVSDDLNTPRALPALEEMLADKVLSPATRLAGAAAVDKVFGFGLATLTAADLRLRPADAVIDADTVEAILDDRRTARAAKDFARADALRDDLTAAGIEVMDGEAIGWQWRLSV